MYTGYSRLENSHVTVQYLLSVCDALAGRRSPDVGMQLEFGCRKRSTTQANVFFCICVCCNVTVEIAVTTG